jgi:hypothetical protein
VAAPRRPRRPHRRARLHAARASDGAPRVSDGGLARARDARGGGGARGSRHGPRP